MFKFIHAADIHLDSPLRGLSRFDDAPVDLIRTATRQAFENLVDLAISELVSFVLVAGDLWDGSWPDAGPGLFFIRQAKRLREARIPVYVVKGNHDAENTLTRDLRFPENVYVFGHLRPETKRIESLNVAIHGQSFREKNITSDLTVNYPPEIPGVFNIGLLHTCLEGSLLHPSYAPVSAATLAAKHYQYWALGHVHQRRSLEQDGVPIVFPGNLQGRFIPEIGPKGCEIVTVDDDFVIISRFEALDVVRWLEETIDLTSASSVDDVDRLAADALNRARVNHPNRLLAIRLHLQGTTELTSWLLRGEDLRDRLTSIAVDLGEIWLERIIVETLPPAATGEFPLVSEIGEIIAELDADEIRIGELMKQFANLSSQLTGELAESDVAHTLTDFASFRALVRRCGTLCLAGEGVQQ